MFNPFIHEHTLSRAFLLSHFEHTLFYVSVIVCDYSLKSTLKIKYLLPRLQRCSLFCMLFNHVDFFFAHFHFNPSIEFKWGKYVDKLLRGKSLKKLNLLISGIYKIKRFIY